MFLTPAREKREIRIWSAVFGLLALPLAWALCVLAHSVLHSPAGVEPLLWRLIVAGGAALLVLAQGLAFARICRMAHAARQRAVELLPPGTGLPPAADDAGLFALIAERIAAQNANLENERDSLRAILASMSEGILVVDSQRRLLFTNPAARKILGLPESVPALQPLAQIISEPELTANIENSIVALQACSFEILLSAEVSAPPRSIQAYCAPCRLEKNGPSGAVAVLHDISDLRRLERMRTEFVANVSHELRTPLTSLLGYLETLESGNVDDQEQAREFLRTCLRQAENLGRIVEDLLRLSKLENPQSDIAEAQLVLNEVVLSAVDQCAGLALKRGITLRCDTPAMDVRIRGDRGLLVQAVGNLIENAIHYNREQGALTVSLAPVRAAFARRESEHGDDAEWEIAVSDTGIGIPAHALQRVFERFYRVDKARSRSQGGTGLGLAIVKHIALAHGASVHVESEVGKGSTFFIRFKSAKSVSVRALAGVEA